MSIQIREYQRKDYDQVAIIINQLLYDIFSPFVAMKFEDGPKFIKNFHLIKEEKNEGLFVLEEDGVIAGVMNLTCDEYIDNRLSLSLKKVIKEYGFFRAILALMIFSALNSKTKSNEVYVDYLVVDKEHRSRGFGSMLLDFGLHKSKEFHKELFTLNVLSSNPRGKALYERFGFVCTKEKKFPRFVRKRLKADFDYHMEMKVSH